MAISLLFSDCRLNVKTQLYLVCYLNLRLCLLCYNDNTHTSLAPEREMFSDPAKSTRLSFPHFKSSSPSGVASLICIVIEKIEWERLNINIRSWFISFRGNACNGTNARTVENMIKTYSKIVLTMIEIIPRICDDL